MTMPITATVVVCQKDGEGHLSAHEPEGPQQAHFPAAPRHAHHQYMEKGGGAEKNEDGPENKGNPPPHRS